MPLTSANNAIAAAKRARKPPTRAVEQVHKKFGGKSHPHVGHTWQSKAKKNLPTSQCAYYNTYYRTHTRTKAARHRA